MDHGMKAAELFLSGYNCAQAVAVAFCDLTGLEEKQAAKMASAFGGGMGRMREVCGAVSGMLFVLGTRYGYDTPGEDGFVLWRRHGPDAGGLRRGQRIAVCPFLPVRL